MFRLVQKLLLRRLMPLAFGKKMSFQQQRRRTLMIVLMTWTLFTWSSRAFLTSDSRFLHPRQRVLNQNQRNASVLSRNSARYMANDDASSAATTTSNDDIDAAIPAWTMKELQEYATEVGVIISWSTLGPGYRAVARAAHNESMILGYVEGFIRPSGKIFHLDKMEIFQPMIDRVKKEQQSSSNKAVLDFGGISFGLGMLMGYRCLLHGAEKGCQIAEFLAIDDEEFQHKRLVRYYKQAGFRIVKYVGEDIKDIPDRLIWGGCGTLMREDMDVLLPKWTRLLSIMRNRSRRKRNEGG